MVIEQLHKTARTDHEQIVSRVASDNLPKLDRLQARTLHSEPFGHRCARNIDCGKSSSQDDDDTGEEGGEGDKEGGAEAGESGVEQPEEKQAGLPNVLAAAEEDPTTAVEAAALAVKIAAIKASKPVKPSRV